MVHPCPACGRCGFHTVNALKQHYRHEHVLEWVACPELGCQYKSPRKADLARHLESHGRGSQRGNFRNSPLYIAK